MRVEERKLKKFRKETPKRHRTYTEKRDRYLKRYMEESWDRYGR